MEKNMEMFSSSTPTNNEDGTHTYTAEMRHNPITSKEEWEAKALKSLKRGDLRKYNIARFNVEIKDFQEKSKEVIEKINKETDEEKLKTLREEFGGLVGQIGDLKEEIRNVKRNKLGSTYYEFTPTRNNRRQRRA